MTTILATFVFALLISLLMTPFAKWFGLKFGAMDFPGDRKIHTVKTPRTGGIAVFFSFILALLLVKCWKTDVSNLLILNQESFFFFFGALIACGVGTWDDFTRLPAELKLLFHVVAASIAFLGDIRIAPPGFLEVSTASLICSYLLTIFWFVLIINAVNLVDGMDGLAAGIVVFACTTIVILNILRQEFLSAMLFASIGGGTLGFLRYNFNPASIFLGDGGSYFLGYAVAGLSIMSGAKTQMSAILLIPMLALGIPLFDTILAPIRRFIRGKKMFSPDKSHIHHRLQEMGLNSKAVVLLLYCISALLCISAVILVNLQDERAGLLLIILGVCAIFFVRKLGYFEYFAGDKIFGWFRDMTDVAGLTHERRSFLNLQMDLAKSRDLEGLWVKAVLGIEMLGFDMVEMVLLKTGDKEQRPEDRRQKTRTAANRVSSSPVQKYRKAEAEGHTTEDLTCGDGQWERRWMRDWFDGERDLCGECLLKLELPLLRDNGDNFGRLWLVKDLKREPVTHYTLRRVEHLRRTLISTLAKLQNPPKK